MRPIVIADDDRTSQELLAAIFSRLGADPVLIAENGAAARKIVEQRGLALRAIITDLLMPDHDGIELIEDLHLRQCRVPVIIVSAQPRHHRS